LDKSSVFIEYPVSNVWDIPGGDRSRKAVDAHSIESQAIHGFTAGDSEKAPVVSAFANLRPLH